MHPGREDGPRPGRGPGCPCPTRVLGVGRDLLHQPLLSSTCTHGASEGVCQNTRGGMGFLPCESRHSASSAALSRRFSQCTLVPLLSNHTEGQPYPDHALNVPTVAPMMLVPPIAAGMSHEAPLITRVWLKGLQWNPFIPGAPGAAAVSSGPGQVPIHLLRHRCTSGYEPVKVGVPALLTPRPTRDSSGASGHLIRFSLLTCRAGRWLS